MENLGRTNSEQARVQLKDLVGKGSKTEFIGMDVHEAGDKDINRRAINAFVLLIAQGHGDEAGKAASDHLKTHLGDGQPLSMREAKQIISECTIHSTNRIALEKEALNTWHRGFTDEARQFVKQEAGRLDLPRDCVLTDEQLAKRVTPLLEELKDLQQVGQRPLPTRDQMTQWAGFPEEDKRVLGVTVKRSEQYKAILAKLDQIRDARQPNASAVKAMALKQIAALGKGLRALEETLETYCETGSHGRNPQMKALLQQVQIEKAGGVDRAYTLYAPEGAPPFRQDARCLNWSIAPCLTSPRQGMPPGPEVPPSRMGCLRQMRRRSTPEMTLLSPLAWRRTQSPLSPRSRRRTGSSPLKTIQTSSRLIWTTRKNRTT